VVVIVAEAAGAPDELAEDDVPERVAPPSLRVAPGHLLCLLPALLLHSVREAPGLRREEQLVQVGGDRGGRIAGGSRPCRGAEGGRRLRGRGRGPLGSAAAHRLPVHHCCLLVDEPAAVSVWRGRAVYGFRRGCQVDPLRIR
jgi:hypothetical protein